ncbi:protein FAM78B-like [Tubulanus polymorphus]|uniref:protein FAM78B-like n=1 Tax=Tubulanus polymorphus TaxID=672921 RepID=UPI003DA49410
MGGALTMVLQKPNLILRSGTAGSSTSTERSSCKKGGKHSINPALKLLNTAISNFDHRPKFGKNLEGFSVVNIQASIDKRSTKTEETINVLKYNTPHFRAIAEVVLPPLAEGEDWDIGWIQACTNMKFINTYGSVGYTSWEFREVETGQYKMISDSDGKLYPWYGSSRDQLAHVKGPSSDQQTIKVSMHDNFCPQVTWVVPSKNMETAPALTHVKRDQKFYTWLVAKDLKNGQFHVLKTIKWRANLEIHVNPTKKLGERAFLYRESMTRESLIQNENKDIPRNVKQPETHANAAQVLVWRPFSGKPKIVIAPDIKSKMKKDNLEVDHSYSDCYPYSDVEPMEINNERSL